MAESNLKTQIERAKKRADATALRLADLTAECRHASVRTRYEAAICETCGEDLGWYCGASPSRVCEYRSGSSNCAHCGEPSERP